VSCANRFGSLDGDLMVVSFCLTHKCYILDTWNIAYSFFILISFSVGRETSAILFKTLDNPYLYPLDFTDFIFYLAFLHNQIQII
jgi:hypothetical protein